MTRRGTVQGAWMSTREYAWETARDVRPVILRSDDGRTLDVDWRATRSAREASTDRITCITCGHVRECDSVGRCSECIDAWAAQHVARHTTNRPSAAQAEQLRNIATCARLHAPLIGGLRAANLRMHAAECVVVADGIDAGTDTNLDADTVDRWIADYSAQVRAEIDGI